MAGKKKRSNGTQGERCGGLGEREREGKRGTGAPTGGDEMAPTSPRERWELQGT